MHPIKRQRAEQRLSLRELARRSGVPAGTISGIERGQREPQILTLAKIADALEVDIEELAGEPIAPKVQSRPSPELAKEAGERRHKDEALVIRLMEFRVEDGEELKDLLRESDEDWTMFEVAKFGLEYRGCVRLYENIERTARPSDSLRETKERLDEIHARIMDLTGQIMDYGDEMPRFARRRRAARLDQEAATEERTSKHTQAQPDVG